MESELRTKLRNRLRRLGGQLYGISDMLKENRELTDVLIQLLAAEKSLHLLIYEQFDREYRAELNEAIGALIKKKRRTSERLEKTRQLVFTLPLRKTIKLVYDLRDTERYFGTGK
jgi:DNA-binding FrmR family transcriptional regulator